MAGTMLTEPSSKPRFSFVFVYLLVFVFHWEWGTQDLTYFTMSDLRLSTLVTMAGGDVLKLLAFLPLSLMLGLQV